MRLDDYAPFRQTAFFLGKNMFTIRTNKATVETVVETETTLSVPVVAVVAGELNGEFLSAEEIAKSLDAWEGTPITLRHPITNTGEPGLVTSGVNVQIIGRFVGVKLKGDTLSGHAVFNKGISSQVDLIIANIKDGKQYEVSTGYTAEMDGTQQVDVRPDHLAILPDEQGACSWSDGCGLPRSNNNKGDVKMTPEEIQAAIEAANEEQRQALDIAVDAIAELSTTVETLVKANEEAGSADDGDSANSAEPPVVELPAELTEMVEAIEGMGGIEAIKEALAGVKANADERRNELVAEVKTNSDFSDADLEQMSTDTLAKLATTLRPASFAYGRNPVANADNGEWEAYEEAA